MCTHQLWGGNMQSGRAGVVGAQEAGRTAAHQPAPHTPTPRLSVGPTSCSCRLQPKWCRSVRRIRPLGPWSACRLRCTHAQLTATKPLATSAQPITTNAHPLAAPPAPPAPAPPLLRAPGPPSSAPLAAPPRPPPPSPRPPSPRPPQPRPTPPRPKPRPQFLEPTRNRSPPPPPVARPRVRSLAGHIGARCCSATADRPPLPQRGGRQACIQGWNQQHCPAIIPLLQCQPHGALCTRRLPCCGGLTCWAVSAG